jgi:S1-C subfamily serine protease
VHTANDLLNALEKQQVGDIVQLDIMRGTQRKRLSITLQAVR